MRVHFTEEVVQALAGLVVEAHGEGHQFPDTVEAEASEVVAQFAPRRHRPGAAPEEQAERMHNALGDYSRQIGVAYRETAPFIDRRADDGH